MVVGIKAVPIEDKPRRQEQYALAAIRKVSGLGNPIHRLSNRVCSAIAVIAD